jgi:hypothetical protein
MTKKAFYQHPRKEIKVADILPYHNNPFVHEQNEIEKTSESIKEFGLAAPIGVDKFNVVVFGHKRLFALQKQHKGQTIEVVDLSKLDEKQIGKLRIIDNMHTEKNVSSERMVDELESIFSSIHDSAGEIEEMMNLDVDFLTSQISEESEKIQKEIDESKPRSASVGTKSIIITLPKDQIQEIERKSKDLFKITQTESVSDLAISLIREKHMSNFPDEYPIDDKDFFKEDSENGDEK